MAFEKDFKASKLLQISYSNSFFGIKNSQISIDKKNQQLKVKQMPVEIFEAIVVQRHHLTT